MHALLAGARSASRWADSDLRFRRPLVANTARMSAYICHHWQIAVRLACAGVGPSIAWHSDLAAAGGGHHDPFYDLIFMEKFVASSTASIVRAIFPRCGIQATRPRLCLLSPRSNPTPKPAISIAPATPRFTRRAAFKALKMLGYGIAIDGDYDPETRHTVVNIQVHAGNRGQWHYGGVDRSKTAR